MPGRPLAGGQPTAPLQARSISRSIQTGPLFESRPVWRVLAVLERACHLFTPDGEVVALVLPEIGDGPLNIVVDGQRGAFAAVEAGTAANLRGRRLHAGGLEVVLSGAAIWEPCPAWDRLRAGRETIARRLPLLQVLALRHAPKGSLLSLFAGRIGSLPYGSTARQAADELRAGWGSEGERDPRMDRARSQGGAARLAGLGGGLTPAGDDFLTGVMLWAWLAHPEPEAFCRTVIEAATPRTTTLSAALLRVAAEGECSAPWHRLLGILASGMDEQLAIAVQSVLAHGHTSGADALAGFIWMGSRFNPG